MKSFLFLLLFFFSIAATAQTKIELKDVSKYIGDSVKLEGKIFGVKTFADNKAAPVLLNLGADFPNQLLTIAVFPSYKPDTLAIPFEKSKGEIALVVGKIELYRGKPQIAVRSLSQLTLLSSEQVIPPGKQ